MLEILANLVIFALMLGLMLFWLSNLLLPLFYSIPRALPLCLSGRCSWWYPLSCLGTALIWLCIPTAAFIGLGYLLQSKWPDALPFLLGSWGFTLGQWVGIGSFFLSLLSRKSRNDTRADFDDSIRRHLKST